MHDQITYYSVLMQQRSPARNPRTAVAARDARLSRRSRRPRRRVS